jgi:hypothetical protein
MLPRIAFVLVVAAAACASQDKPAPVAGAGAGGAADPVTPASMVDPTNESLGGIQLGDAAAKVVEVLGEPGEKGELVEWAATGERVAEWTWEAQGINLGMAEVNDALLVHSMLIRAPSTLTTSRGIGIGATFEQVDAAYKAFRTQGREEGEPEQWDLENGITVGSVYGGTMFSFENGKVSQIFVGAAAE